MGEPSLTTREDFDHWVEGMDDALDRLRDDLPDSVSDHLDGSPASLDTLEAWLLERYPDTAAMLDGDEAATVDGAARYIGEVFCEELGLHWDIDLNDLDAAYFGLPVVTGDQTSTPVAPATLATAAADRRTGSFLRMVLDNSR